MKFDHRNTFHIMLSIFHLSMVEIIPSLLLRSWNSNAGGEINVVF